MAESKSGFYFMRHGQTTANAREVSSGGDRDPGLTEFGCEQAKAAAQLLLEREIKPGLIVASPLLRTTHTANLIGEQLNLPLRHFSSFLERRLGIWNGQRAEITNALLAAGKTPPGGESKSDFEQRITDAFLSLVPLCTQWPLLVSSRGVARVLLEKVNFENASQFPNGGLAKITLTDPKSFEIAKLEYLNLPEPAN